jgi:hypothetical protein
MAASNRTFLGVAILFSISTAIAQPPQHASAGFPMVTVCEALKNRDLYNGATVIVVGKLESGYHGRWLREDCQEKLVTDGYTWQHSISVEHLGSSPPNPAAFSAAAVTT